MARSTKHGRKAGDSLAMSAVLVFNAVAGGLASLYAGSRSFALTVSSGLLAVIVTACYLVTVRRREPREPREVPRTDQRHSSGSSLHAPGASALSSADGGRGSVEDPTFDDFYRQEVSRLVWLLMKRGAKRAEAEDLAQKALIEVWQRWASITNPQAYACRVALNEFSGWARHADREVPAEAEAWGDLSSVDHLGIGGLERQVTRLLERLPPKQRLVMGLTCKEYTPSEIAEITGIPSATVRTHLREARRKMRRWLTDEGLL
jgi:RNA polymerase sigma factor (sigma-70 family)